jgi:hypothetical protein
MAAVAYSTTRHRACCRSRNLPGVSQAVRSSGSEPSWTEDRTRPRLFCQPPAALSHPLAGLEPSREADSTHVPDLCQPLLQPAAAWNLEPPWQGPPAASSETKALGGKPQGPFRKILPGDDLLSHTLARAVPSARRGLTAVFGMGTGVSPSPKSPENSN